jgi:hypothetical protein
MLELGTGKENFRGSCNGRILHNLAVSYLSHVKRGKKKKGNFFLCKIRKVRANNICIYFT